MQGDEHMSTVNFCLLQEIMTTDPLLGVAANRDHFNHVVLTCATPLDIVTLYKWWIFAARPEKFSQGRGGAGMDVGQVLDAVWGGLSPEERTNLLRRNVRNDGTHTYGTQA